MADLGTLLQRALAAADREADFWVHQRHLSPGDFDEVAEITRRHAWDGGEDDAERPGWRVLRGGVIGWWQQQAGVDDATRRRLRYLRTDALRHLIEQDLGWKPYPRSISLWVRKP
ncbi:MAG: hypothetical protein M3P83_05120 [Actinomycetota bacterium]|nr:hypothetical protein [Actinomycetota bacterium]